MADQAERDRFVVVHQAGSWAEALVIRGLLESAGIASPPLTASDPFPLREPPKGMHGVEILALESQAEEACRIIADYLSSAPHPEAEESSKS